MKNEAGFAGHSLSTPPSLQAAVCQAPIAPRRLDRQTFTRIKLIGEIEAMLTDLGDPALVDRIFPQGWRKADDKGIANLYDLCIRTYATRERQA